MKEKTLVILDPTLKKGFTSIPNAVLVAPGLSLPAKALYTILLMFAWQNDECFPGQERLAEVAGCSDRTVRKYLDELRQYGLISWVQRGLNQTNVYYLHGLNEIERLKPLGHKDRKELSGPDRKGSSGQERKDLSDIKRLSNNNVVVVKDQDSNDDESEPPTPDSERDMKPNNNISGLQQAAEKACGVQLPPELLENLVAKYGKAKVQEKMQMLGSVETRNAPGFLIAALQDDYILCPGRQQQNTRDSPPKQPGRKISSATAPALNDKSRQRKKELIKSLYRS